MDTIYIIKALMIGSMGAGGFYFFIALLLHYFPLPLFIKTQNIVDAWAIKHYKKESALESIWNIGKRMSQLAIVVMWLIIGGIFCYLLYNALSLYLPIDNTSMLFKYYYIIAIVPPLLWTIVRITKYQMAKSKAKHPTPPKEEPIRKTLIEQMVEE